MVVSSEETGAEKGLCQHWGIVDVETKVCKKKEEKKGTQQIKEEEKKQREWRINTERRRQEWLCPCQISCQVIAEG